MSKSMSIKTEPPPRERPHTAPCYVRDQPMGGLSVTFQIRDPVTVGRLKARAGPLDLATYLYENILRRAIDAHVW